MGASLAEVLPNKGVVFLHGPLGAGKTTFTRGIVQGFGHTGKVKSPTYTLVEPYELVRGNVYHFDLYRVNDIEEAYNFGIEDYLYSKHWSIIEWPEVAKDILPEATSRIELSLNNDKTRTLRLN